MFLALFLILTKRSSLFCLTFSTLVLSVIFINQVKYFSITFRIKIKRWIDFLDVLAFLRSLLVWNKHVFSS